MAFLLSLQFPIIFLDTSSVIYIPLSIVKSGATVEG